MYTMNQVFSWWLFIHPGLRVLGQDDCTVFWYDDSRDKFYFQNLNVDSCDDVHEDFSLRDSLYDYIHLS